MARSMIAERMLPQVRSRPQVVRRAVRPHTLLSRIAEWSVLRVLILTCVTLGSQALCIWAQGRRPFLDFTCDLDKTSKMEQLIDGTIGSGVVFLDCTKLDVDPERLFSPPLRYPTAAQREGFEADVVVQGILETDGFVRIAGVVDARVRQDPRLRRELEKRWQEDHSSPMPLSAGEARHLFEQSALALLVSSQFQPGVLEGEPVRVLICLPVSFTLIDRPR